MKTKKISFIFIFNMFFTTSFFCMDKKEVCEDEVEFGLHANLLEKIPSYETDQKQEKEQKLEDMIAAIRLGNLEKLKTLWSEKSNLLKKEDLNDVVLDEKGNSFAFYLFSVLKKDDQGKFLYACSDPISKNILENVKHCIQYLIEDCGLNLKKTNYDSWNVMHVAASCGAIDFMKIFLKLDPNLLEIKHQNGKTPLLIAANLGCFKSIDFLLQKGADIKTTDFRGWNIFHVFAYANQLECCKQLVKGAAEDEDNWNVVVELLKQVDNKKRFPHQLALECKNQALWNYLLSLDGVN